MNISAEIVRQARTWIGTRFHHQGRLKKTARGAGGVDCLGLIVGVAAELGLEGVDRRSGTRVRLADLDTLAYGHRPDPALLMEGLERVLARVEGHPHASPAPLRGLAQPLPPRPCEAWLRHEGGAWLCLPEPGMVGLFLFDGQPQHLGIISDYHGGGAGLIHAYAPARGVVEHALDAEWRRRLVGVYGVGYP